MLRRSPYLSVLVIILMTSSVSLSAQNVDYEAYFEIDDCPFRVPDGEIPDETLDCGYLIVPENRANPDSEIVELAVAILYSVNPNPAPDPLIYLEGGPGGSALVGIEDWANSPYRVDRDIILIDQRGTGYSYPTLDCDEFEDADDPALACYEQLLDDGIDLAAYNSASNAADIADLRLALEIDDVNLYGISYGTRLALTIMRDYPEGLRSVILDSTYPPQVAGLNEQPVHGAAAIQHLFDTCTADPACDAAYGDLEPILYGLVDDWNGMPFEGEEGDIYGDDLVDILFQALYGTSAIPTLPYGISLLDMGDIEFGLEILSGAYSLADLEMLANGEDLEEEGFADEDDAMFVPDGDSEGMFNSVECHEEAPFNSIAETEALSLDLPSQLYTALVGGVAEQFATCAYWDSGRAEAVEAEAVSSDIPTLVLAGSFDPTTPSVWGRAAAENLSNGYFVEFPYGGHGLIDSGDCAVNIGLDFIAEPDVAPDTSCVVATQFRFFVP